MNIFKRSLTFQMAVATLLGVLVGLFFGEMCSVFAPWGNAYVMILKITTVPFLIVAIMHGIGQLSSSQVKQILKKGFVFILLAWIINIAVVYLVNFTFPHPTKISSRGYLLSDAPSINFAQILIPDNIFYDLANNVVPAVVIFSLLVGLALLHLKEKTFLMNGLEAIVDALTRITFWIARITPIGTFLVIAYQVGTLQVSVVRQVSTYLILYVLGVTLVVFWIFPRLLSALTTLSSRHWLKLMFPILLLAYTTNAVIVCLPYIIEMVTNEAQKHYPKDEKVQSPIQGIVSVLFNLPLGSLFIIVFILFCSIFYQTPMTFIDHIKLILTSFLASLGSVGLGGWINSLTFLLHSFRIPDDALNIYLATLPFTSGFQAMVSAIEIATLSFLIALAYRHLLIWNWGKILRRTVVTAAPVILLFLCIKWFVPLPIIQSNVQSICELDNKPTIPVSINYAATPASNPAEDPLMRILRTKTLRVGFYPDVPPFCYVNSNGRLAGYDMAFAIKLADDLGVRLELVPLNYAMIPEELNSGLYDIAMSSVSFNTERLKKLCFTTPYIDSSIVFVVRDKWRKKLARYNGVLINPKVKIAVLKGTSYESLAREHFPKKELILLEHYGDFEKIETEAVLLWEQQKAISWVLEHPYYQIIDPNPSLGVDLLSYPIKAGADHFLCYMHQWLKLQRADGFTEKQKDRWILGKPPEKTAEDEPRWSIIRNVLHWVK